MNKLNVETNFIQNSGKRTKNVITTYDELEMKSQFVIKVQ